ncbi:MAG: hypothetical protein ABSF26_12560 [Thermoguttaceae bacterium]|jgi:hypothetical protein
MAAKDHPQIGGFPSTHWSLIFSARAEDSLRRREALDELLRLYLPALRAHLLYRRRIEPHRAEDLLQGFVARQVLERELLVKADATRGRFRSFLLKSLQNYVFTELGKSAPKEVALDLQSPGEAVYDVFELEWARQVLQETLRRMKRDCARDGQTARWELFVCRVVLPTLTDNPSPPYQALIERFAFRSPEQAANALVTAKRQFERTLRAVIAETENATDDAQIDAEIADLCRTLQNAGPLGVDWDRVLIAGPQGPAQERLPAVDDSKPGELACLLSVRGTPEGNCQPAEVADLLRHCLETPVGEYLGIDTSPGPNKTGTGSEPAKYGPAKTGGGEVPVPVLSAEFGADTRSEHRAVSMTLGELLGAACPPLGLLVALKRHARRLTSPGASDVPAEVHRSVYFASIAAAMARHGERISKSDPEVLRAAFEQLAAETWIEDGLAGLLGDALRRLSDTSCP